MKTSLPSLIGGYLRLRRRVLGRQQGQTIVEFALVLPILALMIFAAVDFSRLLLTYMALGNGAREGARQGILYPTCRDSGGATSYSIEAKMRGAVEGVAPWAKVTPGVSYYNASATPQAVSTPAPGDLIKIEMTTGYEPITPLAGAIIGNPEITSQAMMVIDQTFTCQTATPTATFTVTPTWTPTVTPTVDALATSTGTPTTTGTATNTPTATACTAPAAPTITSVSRGTSGAKHDHTITWTSVSGATYNLYDGAGNAIAGKQSMSGTSATVTETGTHNATSHTYKLKAVFCTLLSNFSNTSQDPTSDGTTWTYP